MGGAPRIALLVVTDAVAVGMLTMLLTGCVATPAKPRDRMGDFITNIAASANSDVPASATARPVHTVPALRRAPVA
jgi:hypothetical protein